VCGNTRNVKHLWDGFKCSKCGELRDSSYECNGIGTSIAVKSDGVYLRGDIHVPFNKISEVKWYPISKLAPANGGWLKLITEECPDCPVPTDHSFYIPSSSRGSKTINPNDQCFWFNALYADQCDSINTKVESIKGLIESMLAK